MQAWLKRFWWLCLLVGFALVVGLALFLKRKGISDKKRKLEQVELVSELTGKIDWDNLSALKIVLNRFGVWSEGVYIRDEFDKQGLAEIVKSPVSRLKIVLTYGQYNRDKLFSRGKLISSAKEERNGDQLVIWLGFSKDYLDSIDDEAVAWYLSQSLIETIYNISHIDYDFDSKTAGLEEVLKDYHQKPDMYFFRVER